MEDRAASVARNLPSSRYLARGVKSKRRVLVVEDDPNTLAAVATTLRDEDDFSVWVARSGEQALEVAGELGFDADVVIIDLNVGRGMRGDQFATEYRKLARSQPRLVVLSGAPAARTIAQQLRAAAILSKPYDAADLVRTIRIIAPRPP